MGGAPFYSGIRCHRVPKAKVFPTAVSYLESVNAAVCFFISLLRHAGYATTVLRIIPAQAFGCSHHGHVAMVNAAIKHAVRCIIQKEGENEHGMHGE